MKEPWGCTLLMLQNGAGFSLVESVDDVRQALDGAAKEVAQNDGSPFVRFTSVTGYYPPLAVTVNTMYVLSVVEQTEDQWETQVKSNRKHYGEAEKKAQSEGAGFG